MGVGVNEDANKAAEKAKKREAGPEGGCGDGTSRGGRERPGGAPAKATETAVGPAARFVSGEGSDRVGWRRSRA